MGQKLWHAADWRRRPYFYFVLPCWPELARDRTLGLGLGSDCHGRVGLVWPHCRWYSLCRTRKPSWALLRLRCQCESGSIMAHVLAGALDRRHRD